MQDSMYAYMKPGLVHFKAYPQVMQGRDYVATLEKICEDDFWTAVELGPVKDVRERDRARKMLEVTGMTVCYATQPTILPQKLNPHHFDKGERTRVMRIIKNCVDEAYQLGAEHIRIMSGKDPGEEKRGEAKKIFEDFLHELCDYTKAKGDMMVTLKVFDRDIDKGALIGTFSDTRDVAKPVAADHDNFGVLADLSHFPLLREDPKEAIEKVKDFFMHFHIGNCVVEPDHYLYGDLQPRFGLPGGSIDTPDVRDYFRLLLDMGLLNSDNPPVVSAEVRPLLAEETSALVIANAKRTIRQAWAQA
ncbi:MAG: TIM barrel protein [Candidatus Sedimenticola sp. PURPLELP]